MNVKMFLKYIAVLLSVYSCALMGRFLYQGGFATHVIIIIFSVILAYFSYALTQKTHSMLFLHINLLASVYVGSACATKYYLSEVHSDNMSRLIGNIFTQIALVVTVLMVAVLFVVRLVKNRKVIN